MPPRVRRYSAGWARTLGVPTRGTTAPNRLRRVDRYLLHVGAALLRRTDDPLVVDLGFGASPVTTIELRHRLAGVRPDVDVLGLEIDRGRVAAAAPHARPGLSFAVGGFEVPTPEGRRPLLVRAMNVLRQYDEPAVAPAWQAMQARIAPGGLVVEGTCDELGRRGSWITLDGEGPRAITFALAVAELAAEPPSLVAERLPKVLIHRNRPGERVHELLRAWDAAWEQAAPLAPFGPRQRFVDAAMRLRARGWPVRDGPRRWRLGELTLDWDCVAPDVADPEARVAAG